LLLVNPGGYVQKIMAGDLKEGSLKLVRDFYTNVWQWDDWDLDVYLKRQGTDDTAALPVFPYRDDGLPLWNAIKTFATNYVDAWYERDAVVANDRQIEAFVRELGAPEGGNLSHKGFPEKVMTKVDLASVIARLIWQAGPGHGGINYSQYQYYGPIANACGAAYAQYSAEGPLPQLMDVLPPIDQSISHGDILNQLTQKVFGTLGVYSDDFHGGLNDATNDAITKFQRALKGCASEVDRRNESDARRGRGYVWLHPNNLPNSTNI
jgi:arachidonate 15-lipoxygenase